jgi:hypothetical protein
MVQLRMIADTVADIQIIIINSELRVTIGGGYAELLLSAVGTKTDGGLDIMLNFAVAKAPGLVFKLLTVTMPSQLRFALVRKAANK